MSRGYAILSNTNTPLGKGECITPPGDTVTLQVSEYTAELSGHDIVQIITLEQGQPSLHCSVQRWDEERCRLHLRRIGTIDPEQRRALRMPVEFDSFLYPVSGQWQGRRRVRVMDLSCGGVAFSTEGELAVGERAEIVLAVTSEPLVMQIEILRRHEITEGKGYYAAKFSSVCRDEDQIICEAVFSLQARSRKRRS